MEFWKNLAKYEAKTCRKEFWLNVLGLIAIELVVFAILGALGYILGATAGKSVAGIINGLLGIVVALVFLYLGFITTAKRIWDLTGDKKNSLWYTLGYYVGCAIPFVNFIVGLAGLVFLGFIPGKDVEATEE